ncbi:MAG: hypothetical protein AAB268_13530 [Elusimicrobiota bacterium]
MSAARGPGLRPAASPNNAAAAAAKPMFDPDATSKCVAPASRTAFASSSDKAPASPSTIPASKAARSGGSRRPYAALADNRARWAHAQGRKRAGAAAVDTDTWRA